MYGYLFCANLAAIVAVIMILCSIASYPDYGRMISNVIFASINIWIAFINFRRFKDEKREADDFI